MSDDKIFPLNVDQNPAPTEEDGQGWRKKVRAQVENILADFLSVLPDNYVSAIPGPEYILNFQAIAEQIASVQLAAQEVFEDTDFDFTRSEFLYQILGVLVFPRGRTEGIPQIEGDVTYRDFLKQMVLLLLQGATAEVQEAGAELLTDADFILIEKALAARTTPGSIWGADQQHEFELSVVAEGGTDFPKDPLLLQENVKKVLRALKPAHTLYEYRHLFLEEFGELFEDSPTWDITLYHYEDFRKFCEGAKCITGTQGESLSDRRLFQDVNRDFSSIQPQAKLTIESGVNEGVYFVEEILSVIFGTDTTERAYTTSPSSLSGTATVSGDVVTDTSQDWSLAVEGEIITFSEGPNAGSYRLQTVLGLNGGLVGQASGPGTSVRLSPTIVKLRKRVPEVATGQNYCLEVDRLGVKKPKQVTNEDVSAFFIL